MGNKNSSSSKSKVFSSEPQHVPRRQGKLTSTYSNIVSFSTQQAGHALRDEYNIGKHNINAGEISQQHSMVLYSPSSLDNDDTFSDYIRRAKNKIRTVSMSKSNVGRDQISNTPPAPPPDEAHGSNNRENQKDEFSEFIKLAKKRLRTSSIGKNSGSFKKG